jgi:transcription elongation factor GreA
LNENVFTQNGFVRATEQLEQLKAVGRRAVAERIRDALLTETNASENADYLDAREEQTRLERRIAQLEQRLSGARIVEPNGSNGVIDVGERVRIRDLDTDERVEYELVGSLESDPAAGRISAQSPVGRALLGRRKGEVAVAVFPKGKLRLKILEIEMPGAPA